MHFNEHDFKHKFMSHAKITDNLKEDKKTQKYLLHPTPPMVESLLNLNRFIMGVNISYGASGGSLSGAKLFCAGGHAVKLLWYVIQLYTVLFSTNNLRTLSFSPQN